MPMSVVHSSKPSKMKGIIFKIGSLIQETLQTKPTNPFSPTRSMSQSTSIPKKQQRVRDHGYDNYMEVEKKMRKVLKFQDLILAQPSSIISISRLDPLSRRLGFKQFEAGHFILKFPHVFEIFEHPVQRILYCRLTRKAQRQIEQEKESLLAQVPDAVTRLRKLLMLSNTGSLRLEHVRIARKDFGLPDDFEFSVIPKYPQYFRLFDGKETGNKYIEVVERDPKLSACAIERLREKEYREKGINDEDIRFSFIVNFPPGFKIGKYYKIAVWKWQRLPYWSPYDDISGYDMRSFEAQKRLEKRAVATIHELLSLTVEKKITLERIAHFRCAMHLPKKLKDFLLQHQGIFYISTRGNQGKLHTVFLREAYKKGELIEPNDLYLARRKLAELILLSPRKVRLDRELVSYRRGGEDDEMRSIKRDNARHCREEEDDVQSDLDCEADSDYTDEDNDNGGDLEVGATHLLSD
ncbi:protein ROOT PRIMORDIUM DEFECTIVE 1 [Diospyros lotus]|uniref:protein ROOT PRIMORDIUM DEFECTIVE 1 n=1 Tax=Diospyros lotus TaxID=55363 RepID=UPI002256C0ED|nr:protein ROOT PRIMORDIUM DEFECTIVE 1 [Diospyros lotus]XP_052206296.1 protein ROOT PRIMORDIUM DEFECTIVE 1 [Diospyros lotus]XP_052206297.1 protein ROOT PRIMORDIUM DEFECTIVE 1 [Diospyros lotus]